MNKDGQMREYVPKTLLLPFHVTTKLTGHSVVHMRKVMSAAKSFSHCKLEAKYLDCTRNETPNM